MDLDIVYLSANNEAVDAALLTKGMAIPAYAEMHGLPMRQIGAIGDGINDIPFLTVPGLGLVGTPSNAQEKVKQIVGNMRNGYLSSKKVLDAFIEFYQIARERGITHIVSDRDGVLLQKGDLRRGKEFFDLARRMGLDGNPFITVLTGTAYGQNTDFVADYGLNKLDENSSVRSDPYVLMTENGAIHVNVLTGEATNYCSKLNQALLRRLKEDFEPEVLKQIESEILKDFKLQWSVDYGDQTEKVYVSPKQSMFTVNIPRYFADGTDYRRSEQAGVLRERIFDIMVETARRMGFNYKIL
jgi:hypothetical protein